MKKTAVVTGGSRGIGAAVCRALAWKGWNIAVNWHSSEAGALELVAELRGVGCDAEAFRADVADPAAVEEMFRAVYERFGGIYALVNNAGVALSGVFSQVEPEKVKRMLDVNLTGAFNCTRAAIPYMLKAHEGAMLNISSMWGVVGGACEAHYSAAKAGLIGLTKALAKELGPSGIRVNCLAPGFIDTDMNACYSAADREALAEETPLGRIGRAEECAEAAAFLLGETAAFITGQTLCVDGGLSL